MSTGTSSTELAVIPPPPDPRRLWPEEGLAEGLAGLTDLCRIVWELCEVVQQQHRDILALQQDVAALRAEAATVQDGKRAFISLPEPEDE